VAKDEPVGVSKALYDFVKEHEKFKIEAGFINDKALNGKELEAISKLPGKDQLRHQLVMALNAPIFGLAFTLNQVLAKLVYALDAVKKKKEQG
jgi:large subunit ribosomal protein L10